MASPLNAESEWWCVVPFFSKLFYLLICHLQRASDQVTQVTLILSNPYPQRCCRHHSWQNPQSGTIMGFLGRVFESYLKLRKMGDIAWQWFVQAVQKVTCKATAGEDLGGLNPSYPPTSNQSHPNCSVPKIQKINWQIHKLFKPLKRRRQRQSMIFVNLHTLQLKRIICNMELFLSACMCVCFMVDYIVWNFKLFLK